MSNGESVKLPFSCLTNGGGDTESARTNLVNQRMFERTKPLDSSDHLLDADQMIVCHTPLRKMAPQLSDKFVLVTGCGNPLSVCAEYGLRKAVHAEELFALIPNAAPLQKKEYPKDRQEKMKEQVLKRFGIGEQELID